MRSWANALTARVTVLPTVVPSELAKRLSSSWVWESMRTLVLCMQLSIHRGRLANPNIHVVCEAMGVRSLTLVQFIAEQGWTSNRREPAHSPTGQRGTVLLSGC